MIGSGPRRRSAGPTRSVRLPAALDAWFDERLQREPERSASDLLVALIHGGLRLRDGYMPIHRRTLEHYMLSGQRERYDLYVRCLIDTFGTPYVEHLERWLESDRVTWPAAPGIA